MKRFTVIALLALALPLMGATTCDPDEVPVGQELSAINQAWALDINKHPQQQVERLELVVQLQERRYAQTRADMMVIINCLDAEAWTADPCVDWHIYPGVDPR